MADLMDARICVVGAGVVGLCLAVELQSRGARVNLLDPADRPPNASAVAAGMIAPAFEAALEEPGRGRLGLYRAGRDLWPAFAQGVVTVHQSGALALDLPGAGDARQVELALRAEGAAFQTLTRAEVLALVPGLSDQVGGAVFTPEDWRVDAVSALHSLDQLFQSRGGRRDGGWADAALLQDLRTRFDAVALCAGWGSKAFGAAAPELARLQPIKGELLRFPGVSPLDGPTLRTGGVYLAPGKRGVAVGATMMHGLDDLTPSVEAKGRLAAEARAVFPHLAEAAFEGAVGVRASTPDGLPLVGRSQTGLRLATGFRRNGWLLAPLAARILADDMAGRQPGPWTEMLHPGRFDRINPVRT